MPKDILSNQPGSFAWGVLHDRHPAIIQQISEALPYPPDIRQALDALRAELDGPIRPLGASALDAADWDLWSRGYVGESWYDVPFLWAESFFYRKLLDAVSYFGSGPWQGIDPFEPQKSAELSDPKLSADLVSLGGLRTLPQDEQLTAALDASLWGNRADLGFLLSDPAALHRQRAGALVADDGNTLRALLTERNLDTICIVADNAGRELIPDLILTDFILRAGCTQRIELHMKPQPYYISDATMADLIACLRRLGDEGESGAVAGRLKAAIADDRLRISTHPFYCAPLTYHDLPSDLLEVFGRAGLVILKGDLNYRRLVGDRHWTATMPFSEATRYFPTRVATLRTLKSDVLVGVQPDELAALDATGQPWRVSGSHGLIQLN